MLFSRTDSLQVIFSLVLKVAGRAVSLASALNDCWVIYQVASGSSVGHRTWAEWERDSSGFTASDGFNPGWRYAVGGESIYSVTDQAYMTGRFGVCAMGNFFSFFTVRGKKCISRFTKHNLKVVHLSIFSKLTVHFVAKYSLRKHIMHKKMCIHSSISNNLTELAFALWLRTAANVMNQNSS